MLTFHATGDWSAARVRARPAADSRPRLPEVEALIDAAWEAATRRLGAHLFDGPMCRLESWHASDERLELALSRTSYRAFLGTNLSHPELADRYPQFGRRLLANPVGVSPALITADGFVMMGRRNATVAYYPDRVHPFAGAVEPGDAGEPPDAATDTATGAAGGARGGAAGGAVADVFATVRRELGEELGFGDADVAEARCTGIAEDCRIRQPELIFRVHTPRTRAEIEARLDRAEHRATWSVPAEAGAIEGTLAGEMGRASGSALTPVAVAALLLWGRVAFGAAWFERQRNRLPPAE